MKGSQCRGGGQKMTRVNETNIPRGQTAPLPSDNIQYQYEYLYEESIALNKL